MGNLILKIKEKEIIPQVLELNTDITQLDTQLNSKIIGKQEYNITVDDISNLFLQLGVDYSSFKIDLLSDVIEEIKLNLKVEDLSNYCLELNTSDFEELKVNLNSKLIKNLTVELDQNGDFVITFYILTISGNSLMTISGDNLIYKEA